MRPTVSLCYPKTNNFLSHLVQRPLGALLARTSASATSVTSASAATPSTGNEQWPRPVRVEYAPVRHGFIPEEW